MKYLDLAIANEQIVPVDIKGKNYSEVNQRIKAFRMVYPQGTIKTNLLSNENGVCIFQAGVYDEDNRLLGTGTAYEKEDSSFINKTSYIENCETSAVGRALGMAGFGIDVSVASAEEVQNAINNQVVTEEEANSYTMTFGKYKGLTLKEIAKQDGEYIDWLLGNTKDERIIKMIELALGVKLPSEEEQQERLALISKLNMLVESKEVDRDAMLKHYDVKSDKDLSIEQLKDAIKRIGE